MFIFHLCVICILFQLFLLLLTQQVSIPYESGCYAYSCYLLFNCNSYGRMHCYHFATTFLLKAKSFFPQRIFIFILMYIYIVKVHGTQTLITWTQLLLYNWLALFFSLVLLEQKTELSHQNTWFLHVFFFFIFKRLEREYLYIHARDAKNEFQLNISAAGYLNIRLWLTNNNCISFQRDCVDKNKIDQNALAFNTER